MDGSFHHEILKYMYPIHDFNNNSTRYKPLATTPSSDASLWWTSAMNSTSRFLLAAALLLIATTTGSLQAQTSVNPDLIVDPVRLTRVDSVLERYVNEGRVAGAVGLVLRDGEVIYERAVGWADREANRRMTTASIFRIASQTKAITSTAILMLVEEGKMNLEDPVSRWLPAFETTTVAVPSDTGLVLDPAQRTITIRDLLTHVSGMSYGREPVVASLYREQELGYGEAYGWYTANKDEPICDTMDRLGTLPFIEQPGTSWLYGYNTDVLGCIVERVSGSPLDQFLRERITGPLGMDDTHFYLPPGQRQRLATVYAPGNDGRVERAPDGPRGQGNYVDGPRRSFSGGAGLLSTAHDYARFLEMIRNNGTLDGLHYLAPHTVAVMTSNQVGTLHSESGLGFGLGFQTTDRLGANGFSSEGTFGWSGAYGTVYEVDPTERLVIVLMIQVLPYYGSGIREAFKATVYQALVPPDE